MTRRESSVRFCLRIFFDLMDSAYVNGYIVYNMRNLGKLTPLDFKIVVAKNLIQWHQGQKRAALSSRLNKRKIQSSSSNCDSNHLPEFQQTKKRCVYCASKRKENRKFLISFQHLNLDVKEHSSPNLKLITKKLA